MTACRHNHFDIVCFLLNAGANVHAKGVRGQTALMIAASRGNDKIIRLLHENGADVNEKSDEFGTTALWLAVFYGFEKTVLLLLKVGANVDGEDCIESPLWQACYFGNYEIVLMLLASNANIHHQRHKNETMLDVTIRNQHWNVASLLIACGAKTNSINVYPLSNENFLYFKIEIAKKRFQLYNQYILMDVCIAFASLHLPKLILLNIFDFLDEWNNLIPTHIKWKVIF